MIDDNSFGVSLWNIQFRVTCGLLSNLLRLPNQPILLIPTLNPLGLVGMLYFLVSMYVILTVDFTLEHLVLSKVLCTNLYPILHQSDLVAERSRMRFPWSITFLLIWGVTYVELSLRHFSLKNHTSLAFVCLITRVASHQAVFISPHVHITIKAYWLHSHSWCCP